MLDNTLADRFPRSPERGLIEAPHEWAGRADRPLFPRSPERGLIEASRRALDHQVSVRFPRSPERGLIEAWSIKAAIRRSEYFRAPRSAASLKRGWHPDTRHDHRHFRAPRSAASLKPVTLRLPELWGWQFPRSPERGLIEANLCPCGL